jgi:hypothetical protein
MTDATNTNDLPIPARLTTIEAMVNKLVGTLDSLMPVLQMIPGLGTAAKIADGVGHTVEQLENIATPGAVDSASLAAASVASSTGDATLDARLAQIESLFGMLWPVVTAIAKDLGYDLPSMIVDPAPMVA